MFRVHGSYVDSDDTNPGGDLPDPYQSFGMQRPSLYNDPKDGGQDLTHVLNSSKTPMATSSRNGAGAPQEVNELMIKGTAPVQGQPALGIPPHQ